jgi:hypothetical protein
MATGDPKAGRPEQVTAGPPAAPPPAAAPDGIQPEAAPAPVPLAPLPQRPPAPPPNPEVLRRRLRFLDGVLVLLVLAFAFVTASYPIANSDFFMHAATGRLLAQGDYHFGKDPFTFSSEGAYWVNHSWLFDLLVYSFYRSPELGGALLVVLRGLLAVLLAAIMLLAAHRPGERWWLSASCTALALLALSPRLFLSPTLFSYLFLALTVWLLARPQSEAAGQAAQAQPTPFPRTWWLIPLVCLAWVNLDAWFILGPITVGLFLLGELAQQYASPEAGRPEQARPGHLGRLAVVLALSVAACLVNPHHVRAFTIPPALGFSPAASVLGSDPQFVGMYTLPWEKAYFQRGLGLNAAGLAYFPLVLLGALSFGLTAGAWRWWRLLVWLSFLVLSSCNYRSIPFFAVVAGPITALNFADYFASRFGTELRLERPWCRLSVGGRLLTALVLVVLAVASVPGWVQAEPHSLRRLGWSAQPDEALKEVALQIKTWREEGLIEPGQRWFNTRPEVVSYLAWYCPGEKGFFDTRLPLFPADVAEDYQRVRKALAGVDSPEAGAATTPGWRPVFTRREVRFLLFDTYTPARALPSLHRLYGNDKEWTACAICGRAAIFGWRADRGKGRNPFGALALDFHQRAFGPNAERAPRERAGPGRPRQWWQDLYEAEPPRSPEKDTALQHYARFEALSMRYGLRHHLDWQAITFSALVGTAGTPGGPLYSGALLPWRMSATHAQLFHGMPPRPPGDPQPIERHILGIRQAYVSAQNAGPPASLYLAVRASRRALARNPSDPGTYWLLAKAYTLLGSATRERAVTQRVLAPVEMIRQTQVAYALNQVLRLNPNPQLAQDAHLSLRNLYTAPLYFELRVRHSKDYLRYSRQVGSLLNVPPEKYNEQIKELEKAVKNLDRQLKTRRDEYEINAANKPVLQKANVALEKGLAETAVNLLMQADPKELADKRNPGLLPGANLLLYLLLGMGRLDEVREALSVEGFEKRALGNHLAVALPAYEWFQVQLAAGCGDYAEADRYFAELLKQVTRNPGVYQTLVELDILPYKKHAGKSGGAGELAGLAVGHALLQEATQAARFPWQILRHLPITLQGPYRLRPPVRLLTLRLAGDVCRRVLGQEADLRVLRAWLALEAGDIETADRELRRAQRLTVVQGPKGPTLILLSRSHGLARMCRDLLQGKD